MADYYFEVGELTFPAGAGARWLATTLAETDRDEEARRTVAELFETLEGTVSTALDGDAFRARIVLVDGFYFQDQDALTLMLDAAAAAGAKGSWYSGGDQVGERSTLDRGKRKVTDATSEEFWDWIVEAGNAEEKNQTGPMPAAKAKPANAKPAATTATKTTATKTTAAKTKPAKTKAATSKTRKS